MPTSPCTTCSTSSGPSATASGSSTPARRRTTSARCRSRSGRRGPQTAFEVRAFGPFLVIRTREPVVTPGPLPPPGRAGDAGRKGALPRRRRHQPADDRARGPGATRLRRVALALDELAVARRLLEGSEAGRGLALALLRAQPARGRDAPLTRRPRHRRERTAFSGAAACSPSMGGSYAMIVSLGDLLLDVIVRLRQPLAEGADADATTRLGARRPGGERRRVGGRARRAGSLRRASGRTTRPAGSPPAGSSATASRSAGPVVEGRTGTVVSLVAADGARTMATDRGVSPDFQVGELDPAWLDGCTHLHLPGYSLLRSPIDADGAAGGRARAARERRPLLLERDPRLRAGALPRAAARRSARRSCSRTRTRSGSSAARSRAASGC